MPPSGAWKLKSIFFEAHGANTVDRSVHPEGAVSEALLPFTSASGNPKRRGLPGYGGLRLVTKTEADGTKREEYVRTAAPLRAHNGEPTQAERYNFNRESSQMVPLAQRGAVLVALQCGEQFAADSKIVLVTGRDDSRVKIEIHGAIVEFYGAENISDHSG